MWMTWALLGCTLGSKSLGEDGGATDSSASEESGSEASTATTPSTTDPSATDPSASGESETSSDSGALACEDYVSAAEIGPGVAVTVRSESGAVVYFDTNGCSDAPVLTVTAPGGEVVSHLLGECALEVCDELIGTDECSPGCNDCGGFNGGRLEPAAVDESGWSGRWLTELDVDPACAPDEGCPSTCKRVDQAPAGIYEIALTVYRSCTGSCVCDDALPACGLQGENELGDPVTYTVSVDYPAETSAEIVITDE